MADEPIHSHDLHPLVGEISEMPLVFGHSVVLRTPPVEDNGIIADSTPTSDRFSKLGAAGLRSVR